MEKRKWFYLAFRFLLLFGPILVSAPVVNALEVEIHGLGFQGYLHPEKNEYLGGEEESFNFTKAAVLFAAKVEDDTTVWMQLFGDQENVRVDWAFVDYRVMSSLDLRAGMIRFPMGIYNEYRDNKMLQLSMLEPAMYREEAEVIFESYRGAGVQYRIGPVTVDAFGGSPVLEVETADVEVSNKTLLGGRFIYNTPLEGLRLMASYAAFKQNIEDLTASALPDFQGTNSLLIGSLDYTAGPIDFKAEYAEKKDIEYAPGGGIEDFVSYYVQAGYTFFDRLTPFVRYDYITTDEDEKEDESFFQKEIVLGIGYKFNSNFAFKAEQHLISGYALPVKNEDVEAGTGTEDWSMFVAGVNFMF